MTEELIESLRHTVKVLEYAGARVDANYVRNAITALEAAEAKGPSMEDRIRSEIGMLEKILSDIPDHNMIERIGMEYRLKDAERRLADLVPQGQEPKQ